MKIVSEFLSSSSTFCRDTPIPNLPHPSYPNVTWNATLAFFTHNIARVIIGGISFRLHRTPGLATWFEPGSPAMKAAAAVPPCNISHYVLSTDYTNIDVALAATTPPTIDSYAIHKSQSSHVLLHFTIVIAVFVHCWTSVFVTAHVWFILVRAEKICSLKNTLL